MKKNRVDEPTCVTVHTYMEMSQGNSLCSYLKQAKMPLFFSFLLQNERTGGQTDSAPGMEGCYSGTGEVAGDGCKRVNMVQILCTHACKCKNDSC
jgi:hypothetical protein